MKGGVREGVCGKKMEEIVSNMLKNYGKRILKEVSKKYNINYEEMLKELGIEVIEVKMVKKVEVKSKIVLPFVGLMCEENCNGIRLNHGLYTQCTNNHSISYNGYNICKTCMKQIEEKGELTYGYIQERIEKGEDFTDKNGKKPVNYGNVMEKLNISREDVEKEALRLGIKISEHHFEVKKSKRGRPPKKTTAVVDTSSEDGDIPKRKRGRPKKEKKAVSSSTSNAIPEEEVNSDMRKEEEQEEEEEEEELAVTVFNFKGKKYLKAGDNTIYDFNTHDELGVWNETTNTIDLED